MSSIKTFIDWIKGEDVDDDYEVEQYVPRQSSSAAAPSASTATASTTAPEESLSYTTDTQRSSNKVVNIHATTQLAVVLVKPDRFENAADIADHLKDKHTVVLNLEQTNKDVARRLVDFLSGVAYANEGKIKRVANSTYIITPYNVDIMGDLLDELESNGLYL